MKIFSFKISKLTYVILFIFILLLLLMLGNINLQSVKNTTEIFLSSVFTSLFPFILFTEITLKTGIIYEISNFLSFLPRIFKLSRNCVIPILLGFLCGFPSGAKAVDTMLLNKQISETDAMILLSFVNNNSPVFILTTVGIAMMGNVTIGIILLLAQYSSSILIGLIYSRIISYNIIHEKDVILNRYRKNMSKRGENSHNLYKNMTKFEILQKSILNTFVTLAFILGFMIIFNMLADILYSICSSINIISNVYILNALTGLFEVTRGINSISNYPDYFSNVVMAAFLLGFSGLSIIFQIKACLRNVPISLQKLITFKMFHGILSTLIAYVLLKYTNILNMSNLSVFSNMQTMEVYKKQLYTAYIHSIALILLVLSTYFLLRYECRNSICKLNRQQKK